VSTVPGTYVPNHANPHSEVCHSFVYRWLIARGRITGNYPDPLQELNGFSGKRLLFTPPGMPARSGGIIQAHPGDIVGFWDGPALVHSMVVVTPTSWSGANNSGCFGVPMGGLLRVTCRTFPVTNYP
jgi:hypothetical protein